jgi:hypothetical protein
MKPVLMVLSVFATATAATLLIIAIYSDRTGGDLGRYLPLVSVAAVAGLVFALLRQRVGSSKPENQA